MIIEWEKAEFSDDFYGSIKDVLLFIARPWANGFNGRCFWRLWLMEYGTAQGAGIPVLVIDDYETAEDIEQITQLIVDNNPQAFWDMIWEQKEVKE